jgi:hypothetical protein
MDTIDLSPRGQQVILRFVAGEFSAEQAAWELFDKYLTTTPHPTASDVVTCAEHFQLSHRLPPHP